MFGGNDSYIFFNLEKKEKSAKYWRVSTIACLLFLQIKIVFYKKKRLGPLSAQIVIQMLFVGTTILFQW